MNVRKRIHSGCLVGIENSVKWDNCSASLGKLKLVMPNSYPRDGIFNLTLITIKHSLVP